MARFDHLEDSGHDGDGHYTAKYPTGHTYRRSGGVNQIEYQRRKDRQAAIKSQLISQQTQPDYVKRQIKQTQLELCPIPRAATLEEIRVAPGRFQGAAIRVSLDGTTTDYFISNAAALLHYLLGVEQVNKIEAAIFNPDYKIGPFILAEPKVLYGQNIDGFFTEVMTQVSQTWPFNQRLSLTEMIGLLRQELLYYDQDYHDLPEDDTLVFISKNIYGPAGVIGLKGTTGKLVIRTIALTLLRDYLEADYPIELEAKLDNFNDIVPERLYYQGLSQTGGGCLLPYTRAGLNKRGNWLESKWYQSGCADRAGALVSIKRVLGR